MLIFMEMSVYKYLNLPFQCRQWTARIAFKCISIIDCSLLCNVLSESLSLKHIWCSQGHSNNERNNLVHKIKIQTQPLFNTKQLLYGIPL